MTLKAFFKYENGYRQIIKGPFMNWRDIMEGKNLNPFFKILASLLKKTSPSMFQIAFPHVIVIVLFIVLLNILMISYFFDCRINLEFIIYL